MEKCHPSLYTVYGHYVSSSCRMTHNCGCIETQAPHLPFHWKVVWLRPCCLHGGCSHLEWWSFMPSWQGVDVVVLSLNGLTRQMILTATCTNAFDSIVRHRVELLYQRNYLKCLLFHHPECQRGSMPQSYTHTPNNHCIIHHMRGSEKWLLGSRARCRVINLWCRLRARSS